MRTTLMASILFVFPVFVLLSFLDSMGGQASANFFKDWFSPHIDKGPTFRENRLYLWNEVGLSGFNGTIEAFGDFNSDQYTDVFVVEDDRRTISVYLWDRSNYKFIYQGARIIEEFNITNIVPGDFNYDGKMDLLVSSSNNGVNNFMNLYFGDTSKFENTGSPNRIQNSTGQVLVLDSNADMQLDLYGSYNGERTFWINKPDHKGTFGTVSQGTEWNDPIASPNSNAFVDLDGDCLSDLFVTSMRTVCKDNNNYNCEQLPQFEIWINQKGYFTHSKKFPVVKGAGQVSFSDIDGDGTMDLLFPVCDPYPDCSKENSIHVIYNKQKPLCKYLWDKSGDKCRSSSDLCKPDTNFELAAMDNYLSGPNKVIIPKSAFGNRHFSFHPDLNSLTIRIGDYNLDGFPDLLVPVIDGQGIARIELWQNIPCTPSSCGSDAASQGRRYFSAVTDGVDDLARIQNAYAAAFFDLDENGVLDIFVLTDSAMSGATATSRSRSIQTIYNNFFNDAYFMKTLGLNGVCPAWCSGGVKFPNPRPYGVNFPGASFKYTVSDLGGNSRVRQGVQLTQSGYLSLQTPYVLFGLGRTSNYIEELFMGTSIKNSRDTHYRMWICIIPNAQVVAIPYEPSNPDNWTLELFVKYPAGLTFWITIAILSSLVAIGATICFLRVKEKREDQQEKQEKAHLFSFDAM